VSARIQPAATSVLPASNNACGKGQPAITTWRLRFVIFFASQQYHLRTAFMTRSGQHLAKQKRGNRRVFGTAKSAASSLSSHHVP